MLFETIHHRFDNRQSRERARRPRSQAFSAYGLNPTVRQSSAHLYILPFVITDSTVRML